MANHTKLRVLVVDDSSVYRKILLEILEELPQTDVVGVAASGSVALSKVELLKPDLLTLDIEMPEMSGLQVLEHLLEKSSDVGVVMVSAHTTEGAESTIRALELGAFDFVAKPSEGSLEANRAALKTALTSIVDAYNRVRKVRQLLKRDQDSGLNRKVHSTAAGRRPAVEPKRAHIPYGMKSLAVAIGISTGGPAALTKMIPEIPWNIGVPIFIVQHMPSLFTQAFARKLNAISRIQVTEAVNGDPIVPNKVYIAPGGRHMRVSSKKERGARIIRISDDPAINNCKPSADFLFRSIAEHYGSRATGIIMTGMGSDGTEGLKLMKAEGASIIAQDEATSVVYSMPKRAVDAGIVDVIAPLESLVAEICRTVR